MIQSSDSPGTARATMWDAAARSGWDRAKMLARGGQAVDAATSARRLAARGQPRRGLRLCRRCWRVCAGRPLAHVIGFKRGNGGALAVQYMHRQPTVDHFPELWSLRGEL
ncbi:hypothetical protein HCZ87_15340 [Phaeobacter sp. HF9A]|nr:hypothetical protein [Phaeobacter sp. HF9A]